ncbi:MAG: SulP family inorganic anion transporter, partial [Lachnospiraceae bacterium]|nr:SulP family inorganic anion transporter [Lachnospiraceae bacterium]
MKLIGDYIGDLRREFAGYGGTALRKDLLAGITTGAVALPLAIAFGTSSGADAAAGLIAAIVAAFVIGALSGASYQISGPTGAMAAILVPLSARYGLKAVFAASALAGVLLIAIGLFKMGKIVNLLPTAVITGFTSGIALLIALGQVENLLGVKAEGENILRKLWGLITERPTVNVHALVFGLVVTLFILLWPKQLNKKVPGSLVAVILATAVQAVASFPVETVGTIPQTLINETRLDLAYLTEPGLLDIILLPGVSIAMLCLIESLLCGVVGGRMKGETMNADRELVAQGIGNLILPFMGGVPSTAAIARTSVAIRSGAQTRMTGIIHGVFLLAAMFLLGPLMADIPLSALAGVLIVTAWRMNEWANIGYLFRRRFRGAITKFAVTLAATVIFDLTIAIAAGLVIAVVLFVLKMSNLDLTVSEFDPSRMEEELELPMHVEVIYITGALFFGSVDRLEKGIGAAGAELVILSMRGVPSV